MPSSSTSGSCTGRSTSAGRARGEHGVGYGKSAFLESELGAPAVEMMRAIKRALDPDELFNPGKIFHGPGTDRTATVLSSE